MVNAMENLGAKLVDLELEGKTLYADGKSVGCDVRIVSQMRDVLADPSIADSAGSTEAYFMYRGAGVHKNEPLFRKHTMRYDVTVISGARLGHESNKTLGHYHPIATEGLSYPELYEIIRGKALMLAQRILPDGGFDVTLTEALAGDRVLVPPNYGHITINPTTEPLVMANLVNSDFKSDYAPIAAKRGGAVYAMADGSLLLNDAYRKVCITRNDRPARMPFLDKYASIYDAFVEVPDRFEFLNDPRLVGKAHE